MFSSSCLLLKASRPMSQTDFWWLPPPPHVGTRAPGLETSVLVTRDICFWVQGQPLFLWRLCPDLLLCWWRFSGLLHPWCLERYLAATEHFEPSGQRHSIQFAWSAPIWSWAFRENYLLILRRSAWSSLDMVISWWRHQMETFSALLTICAGNSPVSGEFPTQRPVTRSFDVFFVLRPNKQLSKQWWGWWFETPSWLLWRHRNVNRCPHSPWERRVFPRTQHFTFEMAPRAFQ